MATAQKTRSTRSTSSRPRAAGQSRAAQVKTGTTKEKAQKVQDNATASTGLLTKAQNTLRKILPTIATAELGIAPAYAKAAEAVFILRENCRTKEGKPDYRGQSQQYRDLYRALIDEVSISKDEKENEKMREYLRKNLAYHVGNLLRVKLTPAQLTEYGLSVTSEREKKTAKAQANAAKVQAQKTAPAPATKTEDDVIPSGVTPLDMAASALASVAAIDATKIGKNDQTVTALRNLLTETADKLAAITGEDVSITVKAPAAK